MTVRRVGDDDLRTCGVSFELLDPSVDRGFGGTNILLSGTTGPVTMMVTGSWTLNGVGGGVIPVMLRVGRAGGGTAQCQIDSGATLTIS